MKNFARRIYHACVPKDKRIFIRRCIVGLPQFPKDTSLRISFIGPWNFQLGLGVACKGYVDALLKTDFQVNAYGITIPFHTHPRTTKIRSILSFDGPSDICIILLQPDLWADYLTAKYKRIINSSKIRIGIFLWETSCVPVEWRTAYKRLDAIWTPSAYCAEIFRQASGLPVHVIPLVVPLPKLDTMRISRLAARDHLHLSADAKMILYVFDSASVITRKNPHALVRAFRASGLATRGWVLVLKTKNLFENLESENRLMAEVNDDPAIQVINQSISPQELSNLMLGCDIYASPHCAEGFGLTVAEAMAAEKLVVATDFSATHEFLDDETGYPVAYHLAPVDVGTTIYGGEGVWAVVDEEDLKVKLCEAAADVDQGNFKRGIKARQRIAERFSEEMVIQCIKRSLETQ